MVRTCNVAMVAAPEVPSQTDSNRTLLVATYNIPSGQSGRLESTLRAMDSLGIDIGFLHETNLTGSIYTRNSSTYNVVASDTHRIGQG